MFGLAQARQVSRSAPIRGTTSSVMIHTEPEASGCRYGKGRLTRRSGANAVVTSLTILSGAGVYLAWDMQLARLTLNLGCKRREHRRTYDRVVYVPENRE